MLENFYNKNGLIFWTEAEIKLRETFVEYFRHSLRISLMKMNSAFQFVQVEAPLLTPATFINPNYTADDVFKIGDVVLRPETTMGSYAAAKHLLSGFYEIKYRPPLVVWQHGKSFRNEQDQPTKFMRLKEFYQLEFQILFTDKTANDYYPQVVTTVKRMIATALGRPTYATASDRLPSYSTETTDIMVGDPSGENMEVCSISRRTDYDGLKNIEVAIGTDRCVYQWLQQNAG
jgi:glycyl-tRNA synthetase